MDRKEKLEQITRMLNKDPKLPMERDEIRRALAMKRAQEDVIATMREKQRKIKNLQPHKNQLPTPLREILREFFYA
jgi:regulator of replication initiation timing